MVSQAKGTGPARSLALALAVTIPASAPLLVTSTGTAQTPTAKAPSPTRKLLDEVMMTVDNRVILRSEVQDDYEARLASRYPDGTDMRTRALVWQEARFHFFRAAVRSQSAWSMPGSSPEHIQKYVEKELERRNNEQIKKFGSVNRMQQEMSLLETSAFIRERRERDDILISLARQEFMIRFRDRLALMITPKALRAHYRKRRPEMQTAAAVEFGIVLIDGRQKDAEQRAAQAKTAWTASLTPAEVAEKVGGTGLARTASKNLQAFIREFLDGAKPGDVSAPIRRGDSIYVLKLLARKAGNDFRWADAEVQNQLRRELTNLEMERIGQRLDQEREKTLKIWPPLDRGRR